MCGFEFVLWRTRRGGIACCTGINAANRRECRRIDGLLHDGQGRQGNAEQEGQEGDSRNNPAVHEQTHGPDVTRSRRTASNAGLQQRLQHVTGEILALREIFQAGIHIRGIDSHRLCAAAGIKGNLFQQALHHRMQTPRADVFGAFIDLPGDLGDPPHRIGLEHQGNVFRLEQRFILPGQAGVGSGQDALEILHRQALQFDTDR
jgi:hypothetical protein